MIKFLHNIVTAKPYDGQAVRYYHPKFDGHRLTCVKQGRGADQQMILYTRSQTDLFPEIYAKAHNYNIWPWLVDLLKLPHKSSVDGELYVPGEKASYVKTAIKESDPRLKFEAFAMPWYKGERCYTEELLAAMDMCAHYGISFIPFIDTHKEKSLNPDEIAALLKKAKPETEGWVLKRGHYFDWYKLKREKTIDVIVTGITDGKGKYTGQVGGLLCSVYDTKGQLVEICICSGFTDAERSILSKKNIGRICEVKYQEVLTHGRLRHPIFLRWREDKQQEQCNIAQDLDLLAFWTGRD